MRGTVLILSAWTLLVGVAWAKADDAAKDFEKAAKRNDVANLIASAEALADSPSEKGVKVLVKYGALIENFEVYAACREALAAAKEGEARDEVIKSLLSAKRLEARVLCADALGGSPDDGAIKALGEALLKDKEKPVRLAAIRALQRIERGSCIPPMFERLNEVGFKSGDAEAEELYGALHALTGQAYETLEDWQKWYESVDGAAFDPKTRNKNDVEGTRKREGEGKIFDSVVRSQDFVLVLDISSSMRVIDLPEGEKWKDKDGKSHNWKDPDSSGTKPPHKDSRFTKAKEAFIKFLEGMSERAKFAIVVFGQQKDTRLWKPKLLPATGANKKQAIEFVQGLKWSPATRTDLALEQAFSVPDIDSIYLFSDGIPEKLKGGKAVDIPQDEILEKAKVLNRARKIKINCYAMADNKKMQAFLRQLATDSGGEYKDIRAR